MSDNLSELFAECARQFAQRGSRRELTGIDVGYDPLLPVERFPSAQAELRFHTRHATTNADRTTKSVTRAFLEFTVQYSVADPTDEASAFVDSSDGIVEAPLVRPPVPGMGISRAGSLSGGTLGLLVSDQTGQVFGLSAAHVLRDPSGEGFPTVVQPASRWRHHKKIGTVAALSDGLYADAGLIRLEPEIAAEVRPLPQHNTQDVIQSVGFAGLGDAVMKSGGGTGIACGVVDGIGYYKLDGRQGWLMGFRIRALSPVPNGCASDLSSLGDSGAVWYRRDGAIGMGLHTGWPPGKSEFAIASHLPCVLQLFGVTPV